jgi:membrane-associated phospholipid phosphatase
VSLAGVLPGEAAVYEAVGGWASPAATALFRWINELGNKWALAPAALILLAGLPAARRRWWLWVAALLLAPALEGLAKAAVGRPRPEGPAPGFPSGHVTAAAAFFFLGAYLLGARARAAPARVALWAAAAVLVGLVGIARLVLRAHWPADALGGAALGLACVALAAWWNEAATSSPTDRSRSGSTPPRPPFGG